MSSFRKVALLVGIAALLAPLTLFAAQSQARNPIVIAHRGASGYRPEHTLASYELAIELGADYIEPDLVSTKDGVLVARHENALAIVDPATGALRERTTDVIDHAEFAGRKTTKVIDGVPITGWFTEDFTLAELKTLRAVERIPLLRPQNTAYDGLFEVPTLQEVIDLAKKASKAKKRTIGIYPETKHPTYFDSIGLSLEEPLAEILKKNGYKGKGAAVFIQSFEVSNLKDLRTLTDVPIVQLLNAGGQPYDFTVRGDPRTYADLATPEGLAEIATYANGIGANKNLIVPRDSTGKLLAPTTLIDDAHKAGLLVHGWTFRNENIFLPTDFRKGDPADPTYLRQYGDAAAEYRLFFRLGIDGLFSDNADTAVETRDAVAPALPKYRGNTLESEADFTPYSEFEPLATSAACVVGGNRAQPFVVPAGYRQEIIAVEDFAGDRTRNLWDMNTENEAGRESGRYVYRTHEVGAGTGANPLTDPNGSQVSVTDLRTGKTVIFAERPDWERFDGIVWTPWGTLLAAEETRTALSKDPEVPQAVAGLVYELYPDPKNPMKLDTTKGGGDGIVARPALGAKSHEGMRFDKDGYLYGISEVNGGAIFRFVPDRRGDLSSGRLQAVKTANGRIGEGQWVDLDRTAVQIDADAEARRVGANGYERPEDVETTTSTGRDHNNGGNTLYVAVTGAGFGATSTPGNVFAVDLSDTDKPYVYAYAGPEAGNAQFPDFQSPDNLALDAEGNLAIAEDPGGEFPNKNGGDDIWIAAPPSEDEDGVHKPARQMVRFASLTDCDAEPTGIYFSGSDKKFKTADGRVILTSEETLFVNQQHAGPGQAPDQFIAITPLDEEPDE